MYLLTNRYVVWENLLRILGEHQKQSLVYLGYHIPKLIPHGFASGGAGYVISKLAVQKIVELGPKFPADCPSDARLEDYTVGRYLHDCCK